MSQKMSRRNSRIRAGLALAAALAIASSAAAQYPVEMRVDQGGHLLDANPALGGSGYNFERPTSPIMSGNPFAAGLVRRGMSLQINSPIPSSTSFRGNLGSSTLSDFRRDSVSVADRNTAWDPAAFQQLYLDPTTTVQSVGQLRGLTGLVSPSAQPGGGRAAAGDLVQPLDYRLTALPGSMAGMTQVAGMPPPPPTPFTSSIFGLEAPPRVLLEEQDLPWERWAKVRAVEAGDQQDRLRIGAAQSPQPLWPPPADEQTAPQAPLSAPLEFVLRSELTPRVGMQDESALLRRGAWPGTFDEPPVRTGLVVPGVLDEDVEALADRRQARITDPSLLPGYDVFNDMRLALALEGSPDAAWFQELTASMEMQPELAEELDDEALAEPLAYVQKKLEMPVVTFTGPGASALNNELLKAEAAMDIGHFHEAVDHYKLAHLIDPINPLPMIGRGHALLAAGDYRSSAFWLLKGLERFPDVARFAFDLRALMGGAEVIDIRRADILDRLEQRENAELRFLLGYLEYHGGQRPRGLENLRRAAADPRASALIARYPKLLEAHAPAPMPEAPPPSAPPHPAATPEIPDEGELVIPPSPPQAYEPE